MGVVDVDGPHIRIRHNVAVQLTYITDANDPVLADYTRLTDVALRRKHEPENGLFIAESSKVIRRAIKAGYRPRSFLLASRWLDSLHDVFTAIPAEVPIYVGELDVLEALTGFHLHRGALSAMHRLVLPSVTDVIAGAQRIAIIEDVVDHTNVGCSKISGVSVPAEPRKSRSRIAILDSLVDHTNVGACFRSAAAMGVDAVLVTPQCADPLYRRSVRVSMGTVFQVPWTRIDPWPSGLDQLKAVGYVVVGMTLGDGAITLDELVAEDHQRLALVFGTEGHGLGPQTEKILNRLVTIPMTGGVDSLNVAASSAIAFYATR